MKRFVLLCSLFAVSSMAFSEIEDTTKIMKLKLDEVLVTGIKQEKISKSPLSASYVGKDFINDNEIKNVKELSSDVPNFFMPDYGSKQTLPVYIRGIGSKINAPSIGFYVDYIPHFEKSAFDIDLADVSSIDVLRGPQGTLYGRKGTDVKRLLANCPREDLAYHGLILAGNIRDGIGMADRIRQAVRIANDCCVCN